MVIHRFGSIYLSFWRPVTYSPCFFEDPSPIPPVFLATRHLFPLLSDANNGLQKSLLATRHLFPLLSVTYSPRQSTRPVTYSPCQAI